MSREWAQTVARLLAHDSLEGLLQAQPSTAVARPGKAGLFGRQRQVPRGVQVQKLEKSVELPVQC